MARPSSVPFARVALDRGRAIELWNEDAVRGLARRIPAGGADVVVTSPPYNVGAPYGRYADDRPRAEYIDWLRAVSAAVDRVLSDAGSFFLNVGGRPSDPWLPWDVARAVAERFRLQNVIHWVKSIAIDRASAGRDSGVRRDLALGHYKPLLSARYLHGAHEYIFQFTRRGDVPIDRLAIGVPFADKSNVERWRASRGDLRCRGNTWFLPYPTIRERARDRPHPATFPVELPAWCLQLHGIGRVRRAVDPFVGIGASAVAAARLGVGFVGFDVDRDYLQEALRRVRAERTARRDSAPGTARASAPRRT
ncbi:MAG TPA: site-specific DNA-methyltransferase [Thermoplasmata archaeon]|nr:site-specific DNA-methyltransferase [Thermoplasmata archaeon]